VTDAQARPLEIDKAGVHAIRALPHDPRLDALLAGWSRAVEHGRMWTGFGVLGAILDQEHRDAWLRGAVSIGVTELLAQGIKRKIRRERPAMPGLPPLAAINEPATPALGVRLSLAVADVQHLAGVGPDRKDRVDTQAGGYTHMTRPASGRRGPHR
jgi:hypothetical protein